MKKQLFMALVATTLLSSMATASVPQSVQAENRATAADSAERGETLPCGKLVSSVKRDPVKLIEPTQVAAAQQSKGAPAKATTRME